MTGGSRQQPNERRAPDELFTVLAEPRRRATLRILAEADGPVTIEAVAERLTRNGAADVEGIAAALHHSHVPKLAAAGFVVENGGVIELTERGRRAEAARQAANSSF